MYSITPQEFIIYESLHSTACHNEWILAIDPVFRKYTIDSLKFISQDVYPTYRIAKNGIELTTRFEDREEATPITFLELAKRPDLYHNLITAITDNNTVIAYHCIRCNVIVVKDAIHSLTKCAVDNINKEMTVYQVSSNNWLFANIDMPNYCKCFKAI